MKNPLESLLISPQQRKQMLFRGELVSQEARRGFMENKKIDRLKHHLIKMKENRRLDRERYKRLITRKSILQAELRSINQQLKGSSNPS